MSNRPSKYGFITKSPDGRRGYNIWIGMKERCFNPKHPAWRLYGGRGITVCDRWKDSFENFMADVGPRPSLKHSIDRFPDGNGNYEKSNVRWADAKMQRANARRQFEPKLRTNNTSGHRCVFWNKVEKKWYVHIVAYGKVHHFGKYKDINDAIAAYHAGACALYDYPLMKMAA